MPRARYLVLTCCIRLLILFNVSKRRWRLGWALLLATWCGTTSLGKVRHPELHSAHHAHHALQVPLQEKLALLDFKAAMDPPGRAAFMNNWSIDTDPCEDDWQGVLCDCVQVCRMHPSSTLHCTHTLTTRTHDAPTAVSHHIPLQQAAFSLTANDECAQLNASGLEHVYGIWLQRPRDSTLPALQGRLPPSLVNLTELRSVGFQNQRLTRVDVLWEIETLEGVTMSSNGIMVRSHDAVAHHIIPTGPASADDPHTSHPVGMTTHGVARVMYHLPPTSSPHQGSIANINITNMPALQFLFLSNNLLEGAVPDSWCQIRMQPLVIDLRNNSGLCGLDESCFRSIKNSSVYTHVRGGGGLALARSCCFPWTATHVVFQLV